jgi:hypothetical protein
MRPVPGLGLPQLLVMFAVAAIVIASSTALNSQGQAPAVAKCAAKAVEPCVWRHGRLSEGNGAGLTMWLIGTRRRVQVTNEIATPDLEKYLSMTSPDYGYVFGDFETCPLAADEPGHMRPVCVVGAKNLVVQIRDSLPAFKLRETWPGGKQKP